MKIHSTVGLITNSSTELFVIPKDEVKCTVRELNNILSTIWENYKKIKLLLDRDNFLKRLRYYGLDENTKIEDLLAINLETEGYEESYTTTNSYGKLIHRIYKKWEPGDITIEETADDVLPYELYDLIIELFKAKSYHLG